MRYPQIIVMSIVVGVALATPAVAFQITDRWGNTATDGNTGVLGDPVTVTWGIVADGTQVQANNNLQGSDLIGFMDSIFGVVGGGADLTQRPWFDLYNDSFGRLSEISGAQYVYEPNDDGGFPIDSTTLPIGRLNARPDVRIGGRSIDGQSGANTLAFNFFPDHGDMVIDTDNVSFFSNSQNNYRRLRNVIMHEAGHGLGLAHVESNNAGFLMEPTISASFDGPQLDDIIALQRLYGDPLERDGGNNDIGNATPLGSLSHGTTLRIGSDGDSASVSPSQSDFISIDDDSDLDYFSFSLTSTLRVTLDLTPRGATYNEGPEGGSQSLLDTRALSDLSLDLFDTDGFSLLESAAVNGAGLGESIIRDLTPGTYFARITGLQNNIQLYGLDVIGMNVPNDLTWTAAVNGDWDVDATFNWTDGGPATFTSGDNVTFDDTASAFTVNLTEDVDPAGITVDTAGTYVFTGAGAIVDGMLTKLGGGTLELANDANSYAGPTEVQAGTLLITGHAGAMVSDITIRDGATVVMNSTNATVMSSDFAIDPGGTLQIGVAGVDSNTFADIEIAIVNNGTIIVYDRETVSYLSGTGQIIAQQETTLLSDNAAFDGPIIVNADGSANPNDADAFGSTVDGTTVNAGGFVEIDLSETFAEPFAFTGGGDGAGAIAVIDNSDAALSGPLTVTGDGGTLGVQADSSLTVTGAIDSVDSMLTVDADGPATIDAALNLGGGGLIKTGSAALQIAGAGNYTGPTTVAEGTLNITGSTGSGAATVQSDATLTGNGTIGGDLTAHAGATVEPDGSLAVAGSYTQNPGAVLSIELGAPGGGDHLAVTADTTLAGTLDLALDPGYTPSIGDSFDLITFGGSRTGMFESISGFDLGSVDGVEAALAVSADLAAVSARVSLLGDANFDNEVNAIDLGLLATNWQAAGDWTNGDFTGDGLVDDFDLQIIRDNWEATAPATAFTFALNHAFNVPEPSTAGLLAVGSLALMRRRRRDATLPA